jgi:hypothetical protein
MKRAIKKVIVIGIRRQGTRHVVISYINALYWACS